MKSLPISAAKDFAERWDQDQVIIVTWDSADGLMHVVSYGCSLVDCKQAAQGANLVRKTLGFPDDMCDEIPKRINGLAPDKWTK